MEVPTRVTSGLTSGMTLSVVFSSYIRVNGHGQKTQMVVFGYAEQHAPGDFFFKGSQSSDSNPVKKRGITLDCHLNYKDCLLI